MKERVVQVKAQSKTDGRLIANARDYANIACKSNICKLIQKLKDEANECDIKIAELNVEIANIIFHKSILLRDLQLSMHEFSRYE
jgi:phosphoribosyl-ATP pyrophosphohydrolase